MFPPIIRETYIVYRRVPGKRQSPSPDHSSETFTYLPFNMRTVILKEYNKQTNNTGHLWSKKSAQGRFGPSLFRLIDTIGKLQRAETSHYPVKLSYFHTSYLVRLWYLLLVSWWDFGSNIVLSLVVAKDTSNSLQITMKISHFNQTN